MSTNLPSDGAAVSSEAREAAQWAIDNGMGYMARATLEGFAQRAIDKATAELKQSLSLMTTDAINLRAERDELRRDKERVERQALSLAVEIDRLRQVIRLFHRETRDYYEPTGEPVDAALTTKEPK